jgi:hypothetical protein
MKVVVGRSMYDACVTIWVVNERRVSIDMSMLESKV